MKKTLTTLAALAAASAASAQSSVTMFGVIDAGVSYYQTSSKDPSGVQPNVRQSQWAMSTGNLMGSRFGFRARTTPSTRSSGRSRTCS